FIAQHDGLGADFENLVALAGAGHGVGYGAACPRQLNDGGADAAGGAGNEHTFVFDHVGAVEHVLAGHVGAAEGGQLGVADVGIGLVGVGGGHHNVFGVAAVATVADVVD